MGMSRIFVLSPAYCGGTRAKQVLSLEARFPLAEALRSESGAALGELFAFMSGLYFRGKLAYARRFAAPPVAGNPIVGSGIHVITPNSGLRPEDCRVTHRAVRAFAAGDIDPENPRYRLPLERSARTLAAELGPDCEVVLLGSVASAKYVDVLTAVFAERLTFPVDFVGRGDMSRGGLLLRRARDGVELAYIPVVGAVRRGTRPPRLPPLAWAGRA